jgi:hypothetical protein
MCFPPQQIRGVKIPLPDGSSFEFFDFLSVRLAKTIFRFTLESLALADLEAEGRVGQN